MAILRGPHLHTPLTLLTSDRDALSRVDPAMVAPGDDARYLVTRAGAAALREDEDGLLRPALETADPRGSTHQPLVLLGRRQSLRIDAVEGPQLRDPPEPADRELRDLRHVADAPGPADADRAHAGVPMHTWHRSGCDRALYGGLVEAH